VVVEATGGYEQVVLKTLYTAGVPVILIQANRARNFAKAMSIRAKTDPKDAAVLAEMGATILKEERLWAPLPASVEKLRGLVKRRDQLVQMVEDETKRLRGVPAEIKKSLARMIKLLKKEQASIEKQIQKVIDGDIELKERFELLQETNGVGFVTAAVLLSELPELGRMNRNEAVALAGLAPWNRDSGQKNGQRFISGGRSRVRSALYMGTMGARRSNIELNRLYDRLIQKGKAPKLAKIACARKLLIHLNSQMRQYYEAQEEGLATDE
jgi:transposase